MSLYQRKTVRNTILLWVKLAGFSFFFHMVFLFLLLFICDENSGHYKIVVNKSTDYSIPIIFKQQNSSIPVTTQATTEKSIQQNIKAVETKPKKQSVSLNPPVDAPKKKAAQQNTQKEITPPAATPPQQNEQKIVENKQQPKTSLPSAEQKSIVSDNYREVEALRRGSQLQKELIHHWKPPIGTPATCSCEISFTIDKLGKIQAIKIVRSSGITMYDIAARQALFSMHMPQWTHGKSLIITFQQ